MAGEDPRREAIRSALTADSQLGLLATGGVFSDQAGKSADMPYIIFGRQGPGMKSHAFRDPYVNTDLYMVKGVSKKKAESEAINARCVQLLHRNELNITGMNCLLLMLDSDFDYPETTNGERYEHVGSVYRLVTE